MYITYLNIHAGIITKAAKVEIAVIVTDRSRFPPNITVHIFDAPPPGEHPVTKRPNLIGACEDKVCPKVSAAGNMNPSPKAIRGIKMYWHMNPISGPMGFFKVSLTTFRSIAHPMLM